MSSEKQGGPPSYEQAGGGYLPPAGTQPGYQPGYPPPQAGYQPPPQGYPGQQYPPGPQYGQPMQAPYAGPGQAYSTQQVIINQPGQPGVIVTQARPPDYMVPSILACLCCFCPTGLLAIYYASQANNMAAGGDMAQAQLYSSRARNMMITSVVIGVVWIILVIVLRVVVYSTSSAYNYNY